MRLWGVLPVYFKALAGVSPVDDRRASHRLVAARAGAAGDRCSRVGRRCIAAAVTAATLRDADADGYADRGQLAALRLRDQLAATSWRAASAIISIRSPTSCSARFLLGEALSRRQWIAVGDRRSGRGGARRGRARHAVDQPRPYASASPSTACCARRVAVDSISGLTVETMHARSRSPCPVCCSRRAAGPQCSAVGRRRHAAPRRRASSRPRRCCCSPRPRGDCPMPRSACCSSSPRRCSSCSPCWSMESRSLKLTRSPSPPSGSSRALHVGNDRRAPTSRRRPAPTCLILGLAPPPMNAPATRPRRSTTIARGSACGAGLAPTPRGACCRSISRRWPASRRC